MNGTARRFEVLLVEDNPADAELVARALGLGDEPPLLSVIDNGDAAIERLRDGKLPDLVILDLGLPGRDGREVLAWIKSADGPRWLPVCVFSSSDADEDIQVCYERFANSYVTKPHDLASFTAAIGRLERFWLRTARLPNHGPDRGGPGDRGGDR